MREVHDHRKKERGKPQRNENDLLPRCQVVLRFLSSSSHMDSVVARIVETKTCGLRTVHQLLGVIPSHCGQQLRLAISICFRSQQSSIEKRLEPTQPFLK